MRSLAFMRGLGDSAQCLLASLVHARCCYFFKCQASAMMMVQLLQVQLAVDTRTLCLQEIWLLPAGNTLAFEQLQHRRSRQCNMPRAPALGLTGPAWLVKSF
jgi:hypothetical protein